MLEWILWENIKICLIDNDFNEHVIFIINYEIDSISCYKNMNYNCFVLDVIFYRYIKVRVGKIIIKCIQFRKQTQFKSLEQEVDMFIEQVKSSGKK